METGEFSLDARLNRFASKYLFGNFLFTDFFFLILFFLLTNIVHLHPRWIKHFHSYHDIIQLP